MLKTSLAVYSMPCADSIWVCCDPQALTALLGTVLVLALGADSAGASQNSGVLEGFIAGGFIYISLAGVLAEMAASTELLRTAWQVVCMGTGVWMCHLIHGQSNCDHSH